MTISEDAELALRLVREAPVIAYDTETSGLDWKRNSVVGYVVTESEDNNIYIPIRHGGGGNLAGGKPMETPTDKVKQHPFEKELAKAFEDRRRYKYTTIGHHMKFDMHMSANHGIMLGRDCACTQVSEALVNEYSRGFSLDACCERHGLTMKKGEELYAHMSEILGLPNEKKIMEHFWKMPGNDPVIVDYATGDGISTLELWQFQNDYLAEREIDTVQKMENQLLWTLFRIERRGMKIDKKQLTKIEGQVSELADKLLQDFPEGFNPLSPQQILKLFEESEYSGWPKTKIGNPSFPEKWLSTNPLGEKVVSLRKARNLLSSFINPMKDNHLFDGRVYASLNQSKMDGFGTVTGRFSSSNPNLQQVPKRDYELGSIFRSIFVPDDGMYIYEADYSQCEPRLYAIYAECEALRRGYMANPPVDSHSMTAELLGVERDPTAKRMNLGLFTGLGKRTFASHMNLPYSEALEMYLSWFGVYPEIKEFQQEAEAVLKAEGYVSTVLGRRAHLEDRRYAYRAVSKIIQGNNAELIKAKLLETDLYLESTGDLAHLLMTIHDSIVYQSPKTPEGDSISKDILHIMVDTGGEPFNWEVPMVVEAKRGDTWTEATYGEDWMETSTIYEQGEIL